MLKHVTQKPKSIFKRKTAPIYHTICWNIIKFSNRCH